MRRSRHPTAPVTSHLRRGARLPGRGPTPHRAANPAVTLALALLAVALPAAGPVSAQEGAQDQAASPILITDIRIPLRDGVRLAARLYRPAALEAPAPVIVTLTPYTSDDAHARARFFAEHGYAYLNVDVRGRGASEGEYWPLAQDGPDGADVVRWAASQPWSDGRVAMRGGSYRGMVQWQTLAEAPDALATAVPTAAVYPGWDYPNPGGIFLSYATQWLAFTQGAASQASLFGDGRYWTERFRTLQDEGRPFADLDEVTGIEPRVFEEWIRHPWFDDYWRAMSPSAADYRRMDLPILTITGHFDGDQPGAMKYYRDHIAAAPPDAAAKHWLLIGPWSHAGTRNPVAELGEMTFGENSVIDMEALHLQWFDHVLRDGARPPLLEDRVTYYLMGADVWRYAPSLDRVSDDERAFFLASPEGDADDVYHSGVLADAPAAADVDSYVHDPLAERDEVEPAPVLVYHTAPLTEPLDVAGYARLEAWIELDVPDTDIVARIEEIRPDGDRVPLATSELRARHRHGVDRSVLAEPGVVEEYTFDRFYWFARRIPAGSRIRLTIEPLSSPHRQKNYQSGGDPMTETPADARAATVRLHHGPDRPSRLVLPVAARDSTDEG